MSQLLRRKVGGSDANTSRRESSSAQAESPGTATALAAVERQIRSKLQELGPGASRSSGFRRWVIALVLTHEYSPRMQAEPKFVAMVQAVLRAIELDAGLKERFDSVMDELSRT